MNVTFSRLSGFALAGIILALCHAGPVRAQAGNMPYQPGAGVGLSYGARQAILNAKLLDSRPRNLMRGADGGLLDVTRRGSQAVLRSPETGAVIPGGSPRRGWSTGLGTGLGWGGGGMGSYSGIASYRYGTGAPAASMMQWISMLDSGSDRPFIAGLAPLSEGLTPLDIWIGQADWG